MKKIKNKKGIYVLCSLSIMLVLGLTACTNSQNKTTSADNQSPVQQKSSEQANNSVQKDSKQTSTQSKVVTVENSSAPKFTKKSLDKGTKLNFSTNWENSISGSYSACIDGKGSEALEEGIGKIAIKNSNGDIFTFEISDNKKLSPRHIEWVDDENLLVIIGSSYGTVSKGGNLYLLNVVNGKTSTVFETPDKKQQIVSTQKSGNNVNLKVNIYDDDNYNKSHLENWTLYSFDKNLEKKMDIKNSEGKVIYEINSSK